MKIISADERLAEKRGAKILLLGPPGVGKTTQLRRLDPKRTLFIVGTTSAAPAPAAPATPATAVARPQWAS